MKQMILAAALAATTFTAPAMVAADTTNYALDASHSQILFGYNHLGYSTTWNMFSGFEGTIAWDKDAPENSSVSVEIPVMSLFTGWEARFNHFMADDFFGAAEGDMITFTSTGIEVTGDNTANITGDLTINGMTKSVVLDARLNQEMEHPMAKKPWAGFDATTTLMRSDFGLGNFAPFVSDELDVKISIEAMQAE